MSQSDASADPVLWLKKIVLLRRISGDAASIIREITFRRGLNVILSQGGRNSSGHSVGKTMLTRLIRYTLGERYPGDRKTKEQLAENFEEGGVVAIWSVNGVDWSVLCPFVPEMDRRACSKQTDDWNELLTESDETRGHDVFLDAVETAVCGDRPPLHLGPGRLAEWSDVLPWLSRDVGCHYRGTFAWRDSHANIGRIGSQRDNALVAQWLLGLWSAKWDKPRHRRIQMPLRNLA